MAEAPSHHVTLDFVDPNRPQVWLGDVDVTDQLVAASVSVGRGGPPLVTLQLAPTASPGGVFDGLARVQLLDEATAAQILDDVLGSLDPDVVQAEAMDLMGWGAPMPMAAYVITAIRSTLAAALTQAVDSGVDIAGGMS